MRLITLIFEIFRKFVPIPDNDMAKLEIEAQQWESKAMGHSEGEEDTREGIQKLYAKLHKPWYVRLGIAALYLPLVNYIMNIGRDNQEEE